MSVAAANGHLLHLQKDLPFLGRWGVDLDELERLWCAEPGCSTPIGPFIRQGNTDLTIDARGEGNNGRVEREKFVTILDIRAEKQVTIGRYGVLHFYFDVFNVLNSNIITEFRERLGSRYLEIQDILPPRVIRLGGAWDF